MKNEYFRSNYYWVVSGATFVIGITLLFSATIGRSRSRSEAKLDELNSFHSISFTRVRQSARNQTSVIAAPRLPSARTQNSIAVPLEFGDDSDEDFYQPKRAAPEALLVVREQAWTEVARRVLVDESSQAFLTEATIPSVKVALNAAEPLALHANGSELNGRFVGALQPLGANAIKGTLQIETDANRRGQILIGKSAVSISQPGVEPEVILHEGNLDHIQAVPGVEGAIFMDVSGDSRRLGSSDGRVLQLYYSAATDHWYGNLYELPHQGGDFIKIATVCLGRVQTSGS